MNKVKVKDFKLSTQLIGKSVPNCWNGHAGKVVETLLESMGITINRGHGPDILLFGLEVKTRDVDATSPQTIADMRKEDIINTDYKNSHVFEKFQQQLRIKIQNNIIVSVKVYDFSPPHIQCLIEQAYNNGREYLQKNEHAVYTPSSGFYGYFEVCHPNSPNSFSFRVSDQNMTRLEKMATSTFTKFFDYDL